MKRDKIAGNNAQHITEKEKKCVEKGQDRRGLDKREGKNFAFTTTDASISTYLDRKQAGKKMGSQLKEVKGGREKEQERIRAREEGNVLNIPKSNLKS